MGRSLSEVYAEGAKLKRVLISYQDHLYSVERRYAEASAWYDMCVEDGRSWRVVRKAREDIGDWEADIDDAVYNIERTVAGIKECDRILNGDWVVRTHHRHRREIVVRVVHRGRGS